MQAVRQFINIFRIPDLRRKVFITLGLLALCRIGVYIPLPAVDTAALQEWFARAQSGAGGRLLGMVNLFTGGALKRGAIFGLGIMPYISASIIFQLLANAVPRLERLRKEGESGRRKLNQYTRIATVFICLFQGIVFTQGVLGPVMPESATESWLSSMIFTLTNGFMLMAGTMFLMWVGEQIDEHGIGNGISLIIMTSILSRLPGGISTFAWNLSASGSRQNAVLTVMVMVAIFVAIVVAVVYITQGERRVPIQQAKHVRGPKVYGGQKHYLPLKVNQAGVIPIIFAQALLMFPATISQSLIQGTGLEQGSILYGIFSYIREVTMPQGDLTLTYVLIYGALIFFFCYFWTAVTFNPQEMSENLKDHGSFIPGIRPGERTASYLEGIMNRVTMAGSFFLITIALMPMFISAAMGVRGQIAGFYGGTSILIVVGVTLDLVRRINNHLEMRRYSGFASGRGTRRRRRR